MTVKELIELLENMPSNAIVVGDGYEDGLDVVTDVQPVNVKHVNSPWYCGEFTLAYIGGLSAVYLKSGRRKSGADR